MSANPQAKTLSDYEAVQPGAFGLENYAHPAANELFQNAVMRKSLADHRGYSEELGSTGNQHQMQDREG
jgi:hypothetical protein